MTPREGVERPEIVCLCGSTRFIDTFQSEYGRLTDEGKIVLTVGRVVPQSEQSLGSTRKVALDALHLRKIDLADRVLVLNVGGYVGPSTRREIAYATEHGRPIDLLYPDAGLDGAPPHPAATAREEAWKAMVEALTYIASHRGLTLLGDGSYSDGVRDGWIELADAADRALALARSTGGA